MKLKNQIGRFFKTDFLRNSLTLSGGVAVAQVLPFLFYPLLGRIFTVEEFGLLATITSITSILVVVSTGKYESGILIADSKREAGSLALLSLAVSFVFLVVAYLLMQFVLDDLLCGWLKEPGLSRWLIICPISAFSIVVFNVYNEWCVREKYFKGLSANKIVNSGAIVVSKALFGLWKVVPQGLVIGDTLGRIISAIGCAVRGYVRDRDTFKGVTVKDMKGSAVKYSEFPKYTMPGQLLNTIGMQLPVLLIAAYFDKTEVGYFANAMALFAIPITVVSGAVRDVFRQRANEEYKANGNCLGIFKKVTLVLSLMAIVALGAFVWFLPQLMELFMGHQWYRAGQYAQYLSIGMALSFVSNSLSGIFIVVEKLKALFYWQVFFVASTLAALLIGGLWLKSMVATMILFSLLRGLAYLISILLTYHYSKGVKA